MQRIILALAIGLGAASGLAAEVTFTREVAPILQQNCQTCHGEFGRGDGPTGRVLRPRPADLQQHVTQHTEGQLYWWISKGFPGTAMPAWEDSLSEDDRWNVLNYIVQNFRPDATPSPVPVAR